MRRFGAISGLRARLLPMNRLRLVAPTNVLDAASRVTMALNATALYTTEPVAQQVARKAAGEELTKFTNIFRAEVGKDQYTDAAQREAAPLSCIDPRALAVLRRKQGACLLFSLPSGAISPRFIIPLTAAICLCPQEP